MTDSVLFWIFVGVGSIYLLSRLHELFLYFWRYGDLTISFGTNRRLSNNGITIYLNTLYGPKKAVTLHILYTLFVLSMMAFLFWVMISI